MSTSVLISICIPAYQRTAYLKRVLDSIAVQTYRNFEVIVTDDSATDEVQQFINQQYYDFPLQYVRNQPAKGTPLNWMEGIAHAKGEWIKIIHDDDWLTSPDTLQQYAASVQPGVDCIFSGYIAHFESDGRTVDKTISQTAFKRIRNHPFYLFASNELGPPSVVMFRKEMAERYDPSLKWLVDLEAYIRMLQRYACIYISQPLITMSYNATQVTNDCFRNPDVEIREALVYYRKQGAATHIRLLTYDAWWRLLRNLSIRTNEKLVHYAQGEKVPVFLQQICSFQGLLPPGWLQVRVLSKIFMFVCYVLNSIRGFNHHH